MDEKDALFGMFKHYMDHGLHHQQQRSQGDRVKEVRDKGPRC